MKTRQYLLTVEECKRLIAKAIAADEKIMKTAMEHTLVIISGTTNGFLAEEMLKKLGQLKDFDRRQFRRGVNVGPFAKLTTGAYSNTDVVIRKGEWLVGTTIYDITDELTAEDIIIKGANALQPDRKVAGVQIGNPKFGTLVPILTVVVGRRVRLVIPVGLEKLVCENITDLAKLVNDPDTTGLRLQPVTGDIVTEIEAFAMLYGAEAHLVAAGGIGGAEGSCSFAVTGEDAALDALAEDLKAFRAAEQEG